MRAAVALIAGALGALGCAPSAAEEPPGESHVETRPGGSGGAAAGQGGAGARSTTSSAGGVGMFSLPDGGLRDPAPDAGCERIRDARPVAPNVHIVLDRSGSMTEGVDRWAPAVGALGDVVSRLQAQIRFGLTVFPSLEGACTAGELRMAPALEQGQAIIDDLAGPAAPLSGGGTPVGATLSDVTGLLSGLEGTSYVLLVTDGAPNCNPDADAATCTCTRTPDTNCRGGDLGGGAIIEAQPVLCLDDASSVAAVEALAEAGIRTFVIGYDTSDWAATLDAMAAAGDTERDTHFPVSDGSALSTALEQISDHVVTCTFELSEAPPSEAYVTVTVDGTPVLPIEDTDGSRGFQLVDERIVELVGDTCRSVSDGNAHDIAIVRECEPVIVR